MVLNYAYRHNISDIMDEAAPWTIEISLENMSAIPNSLKLLVVSQQRRGVTTLSHMFLSDVIPTGVDDGS